MKIKNHYKFNYTTKIIKNKLNLEEIFLCSSEQNFNCQHREVTKDEYI